ncbi:hypothetical protein M422DRAFT_64238 [Sphaerobolus stellatus SS14]|nr:hypothetical protein M422DRAFT_64238 [Sphaerobolus stellatus SS14]
MNKHFAQLLSERYVAIKAQYPGEGRRRWKLRALQDLWSNLSEADAGANIDQVKSAENFTTDDDPLDSFLEGEEIGVLIRTDFSNESAWGAFYAKFRDAEKEIIDVMRSQDSTGEKSGASETGDVEVNDTGGDKDEGGESDEESDEESAPSSIIKVLNPGNEDERKILNGISNLSALRLLNDVDIMPCPMRPATTKRISPQNRLIDLRGWQEIYEGKNIWIYDARSNSDESARVVNQTGDFYGTATADSWRARVLHICELQFNLTYFGMKIDFGGLDRWDYEERKRNLDEANVNI